MKSLVDDDHALIRDAMRQVLLSQREGAEVLEAADARQALSRAAAQAAPPDGSGPVGSSFLRTSAVPHPRRGNAASRLVCSDQTSTVESERR